MEGARRSKINTEKSVFFGGKMKKIIVGITISLAVLIVIILKY